MATRKHISLPDVLANCAMGLTSLLLVVYNVLRIINVPVTHDEASTHAQTHAAYWDIMRLLKVSANDHLLNTILTKTCLATFGDTAFWLRFPNLLAQVVFLVFAYRLCRLLFTNWLWQVFVFLALCLQPFVFEFWGLCRGYGLAVAFTTASVYYLLRFADAKNLRHLYLSLSMAIIAVYANFSLLDYYCGVVGCTTLYLFTTILRKETPVILYKGLAAIVAASVILFLLVAGPIAKLVHEEEFYYGGHTGLVKDTITSLLREDLWWSGDADKDRLQWVAASILPVTAIMGIYYIVALIKKGLSGQQLTGCLLFLLFAAPLAGIKLQHHFLHTLYPVDRTAIYLVPLFLLSFCYWLYMVSERYFVPASVALYALTFFLLLTFVQRMNISTTRMWWYGCNDVAVLNRIADETKNEPTKSKVAVYWIFIPEFDYYMTTRYSRYIMPPIADLKNVKDSNINTFDYYYISNDCNFKVPPSYTLDTSFYGGGFTLWRKNE